MRMIHAVAVAGLLSTTLLVTGCGVDSVSAYCGEVSDRQTHLSEVVGGGATDALIQALPDFRALASKAPADIASSWTTFIDALVVLQQAVASGNEAAQASAATALEAVGPSAALAAIEQQVRDVCHTPLTR